MIEIIPPLEKGDGGGFKVQMVTIVYLTNLPFPLFAKEGYCRHNYVGLEKGGKVSRTSLVH
jgi:hypothetical protein